MGTCSRIATMIDADMLDYNVWNVASYNNLKPISAYNTTSKKPIWSIFPAGTPDNDLPHKSGKEVYSELGGRYLLTNLLPSQVSPFGPPPPSQALTQFLNKPRYMTPTPYSPEEAIAWLTLPAPNQLRLFVLLVNPYWLTRRIKGPRWVRMGGGIEYLVDSIDDKAIVNIGTNPNNAAQWPLLVT